MQRTINGGRLGTGVTEERPDMRTEQRARGAEDARGRRLENCRLLQLQQGNKNWQMGICWEPL